MPDSLDEHSDGAGRRPARGDLLPLVPRLRTLARGFAGGDAGRADDLAQTTLVCVLTAWDRSAQAAVGELADIEALIVLAEAELAVLPAQAAVGGDPDHTAGCLGLWLAALRARHDRLLLFLRGNRDRGLDMGRVGTCPGIS